MIRLIGAATMIVAMSFGNAVYANTNDTTQAVNKVSAASLELQNKLNVFDGYQANFKQVVTDIEANIIHQADGKLVFKQPGKFIWEVTAPEEELLISNGQYVWWYNPFVEQVSIFDVQQAVTQTPFALLVSKDPSIWKQFSISKENNIYVITPVDLSQAQVIKLTLTIIDNDLEKIVITSRSQQVSEYTLSEQSKFNPQADMFEFEMPAGIDVDDQRSKAEVIDGNVSY
ncbi:outer membrane lipoprotein chaperone LolA [Psychrosphaera haliotis]|uniref:Outer-membrane lipoprotein carrier protein n=1 Tax=Psychrosphaera haliotis TaxID=555083 RepID=A0A6N8F899_9GAMM|nr:outer membrane lipoprotein chaperone LolA [Psychrosphaera haliotis]MUH71120.1 outer membrane lipoprotein chaperone LolA [Psychrosphaera haliotis]